MSQFKKAVTALIVLVVVVVGLSLLFRSNFVAGATGQSPACSGSTSCTFGNFFATGTSTGTFLDALLDIHAANKVFIGGSSTSTTNSVVEMASAGSCNTATTTLFNVLNPTGSTSTVRMIITATGQASSTNLTVGTSTAPSGYRQTDLSGYLAINYGVVFATSSVSTVVSGQTTALGTGQSQAGTSTSAVFPTILVGPSEYVGAFSTSTYPISGAVASIGNFVPGLTNCTYKLVWQF